MGKTTYQQRFSPFLDNKRSFFTALSSACDKKTTAQQQAGGVKYPFLLENKLLIEQEFNQLFASLNKKKREKNDELWFYCYYCCLMLRKFYEIYDEPAKVNEYADFCKKIEQLIDGTTDEKASRPEADSFLAYLGQKISESLAELADTPMKLSKLRGNVGYYNILRIYWYFCRTTIAHSLLLARDLKWLEKLGRQVNVDDIIHTMERPNEIFRFLSVGFFVTRLIMNAGMVLKHTAFCKDEAQESTWTKRLSHELYKRHAVMFNDIMWSAVNGVTNYNQLFGISNLAAGWILAGFLFVDVSVILWRRHLEHTEFLTKRSQYIQERDDIERGGDLDRYAILTEQIHQLDLTWQANDAKYWFDASAAFLLASGFTASMIVSLPVLFIGSYVVCTFAVGMYLSDDAYRNYKEKSLILDEVHLHSKMDPSQAIQDYQNARNEFAFTLAKNTIIPMFLIGTFTLCWQAALLLTIAYAGYSLYRSYPGSAKDEALVYDGPQNALASPA